MKPKKIIQKNIIEIKLFLLKQIYETLRTNGLDQVLNA